MQAEGGLSHSTAETSCLLQWAFKLHNGRHIIKDTDKTTLAFNNADDARQWHQTFQSVIADLAAKQGVEVRYALTGPAQTPLGFHTSGQCLCHSARHGFNRVRLLTCIRLCDFPSLKQCRAYPAPGAFTDTFRDACPAAQQAAHPGKSLWTSPCTACAVLLWCPKPALLS